MLKINNFALVVITSLKFSIVFNNYFTMHFIFELESSRIEKLYVLQYFKVIYILVKLKIAFKPN